LYDSTIDLENLFLITTIQQQSQNTSVTKLQHITYEGL